MKYLFKIASLCLLTISLTGADLKSLKSIEEARAHSDEVMELFEGQKYELMFRRVGDCMPLPENELENLKSSTIRQINGVAGRFGEIIGHNFIKEEAVEDFYIRRTYVLRFENHMLRVYFIYYRNNEGWLLNNFKWDDNIDELFPD